MISHDLLFFGRCLSYTLLLVDDALAVPCGAVALVDFTSLDGSDSFTSVLISALAVSIGLSCVASASVGMFGVGSLCIAVSVMAL